MSLINITNIQFDQETALFQSSINMQITFDVLRNLDDELEWKLIYIGSPDDEKHDQVLDCFSMPPLQQGTMQFTLQSQPPNYMAIPTKEDLFGVTAVILTTRYKKQEFFRVGYYVYNTYLEADLIENEPNEVLIERVYRQINTSSPRVTRYNIDWEGQMTYHAPQINTNHSFMFQQQPLQGVFYDVTNHQNNYQQQDKTQSCGGLNVQNVF